MSTLKKLAGQTAVYGLSSILGRLMNYLLVPVVTAAFTPFEYGISSEFYAYVAFFGVLLTFGLETTFFRFVNKSEDKEKTFNQIFSLVLIINVIFLVTVLLFSQAIANWMLFPQYQNFVVWFAFILVIDATSALLLAKLRQQEKAKKFAFIQLSSIGINILLTLVFILYAKSNVDAGNTDGLAGWLYSPEVGIGCVFIANLASSILKPLLLYKELKTFRFMLDKAQSKILLLFALPLAISGFAGIANETIDRILLKRVLLKDGLHYAETQVGIYSANYKLSILITLFIQAFRYAAEPFFFAQEKNEDRGKIYAKVMNYFVITVTIIFLGISLNLEIFKWFIPNPAYWEGLVVVPILLLANVFLGIYFNQSIWYKLADKPKFGAYIAVGGAIITIVLNIATIPYLGYVGSAWTTLIVYFSMCVASWYLGQKYYPIKYNVRKILLYIFSSGVLVIIGLNLNFESSVIHFISHQFLVLIFIAIILFIERPFKKAKNT